MAVQIPEPGTGNGSTGDNEYVFRSKVKSNFNDQTNAASRLVGEGTNNVMQVGAFGLGGAANQPESSSATSHSPYWPSGFYRHGSSSSQSPAYNTSGDASITTAWADSYFGQIHLSSSSNGRMSFRYVKNGQPQSWREVYHTSNTTKDSNGFLKAASPIVKVFSDKIELNDDAKDQDVTFIKNGVGNYTIKTLSGLSTDGWYLELPKDLNGNPKVAVTLSESDGVINLKSYKRIFSMETFTFTPALDQPLDIPDGRWIDLRLNEIENPEILPEA